MKGRLTNKVIIITGGTGLFGRAIIERLELEGAICINFDINIETNDTLNQIYCDITDSTSVDKALQLVFSKYQHIDGLVNNAYKTIVTKCFLVLVSIAFAQRFGALSGNQPTLPPLDYGPEVLRFGLWQEPRLR
jgi:NAD(P)-dependent dehydrogenase (short-subunit alcohol dehydrogenase family)